MGGPKSFLEAMLAWHGFGLSVYFGCLEGLMEIIELGEKLLLGTAAEERVALIC